MDFFLPAEQEEKISGRHKKKTMEYFRILNVRSNNKYLLAFLEFYGQDIEAFFPGFVYKPELNTQSFFILRDMAVAGVVLARDRGENELFVSLDFVIPQYRDFKLGKYLYESGSGFFPKSGYRHVVLEPKSKKFEDYLKKMGFIQSAHENSASYHKRYNDL